MVVVQRQDVVYSCIVRIKLTVLVTVRHTMNMLGAFSRENTVFDVIHYNFY